MSVQDLPQPAAQAVSSPAIASGLTSQEAEARLKQFGPNDPAPPQRHSAILDLLRLFSNPLTLMLLIAVLTSAFLGQATDAGIIIAIVLLSTALDFAQTHKSQRAIEQLRQRVAPTATVLRDGKWQETRRSDVGHLGFGELAPSDLAGRMPAASPRNRTKSPLFKAKVRCSVGRVGQQVHGFSPRFALELGEGVRLSLAGGGHRMRHRAACHCAS